MASIELDSFLRHRPEVVWRALTEPELLGRWCMPNDFEPVLGRAFRFDRGPALGEARYVECRVLSIEPVRALSFTWLGRRGPGDPPFETRVTFRLVPEGRGTRLFFTHDGFDPTDEIQSAALRVMGGGWKSMVTTGIAGVLDEIEPAGKSQESV